MKNSLLIIGLFLSALGAHFVSIFVNSPAYFSNNLSAIGALMTFYLGSILLGGIVAAIVRRTNSEFLLILILTATNCIIYLNIILGKRIIGFKFQAALIGFSIIFGLFVFIFRSRLKIGYFVVVFGAVLAASSFVTDIVHFSQHILMGMQSSKQVKSSYELGKNSIGLQNFTKGGKPLHIFHVIFDGMSGTKMENGDFINDVPFYNYASSGILFNNAHANGHKTEYSLPQIFSGKIFINSWKEEKLLHQEIKKAGYQNNHYLEYMVGINCEGTINCITRRWALYRDYERNKISSYQYNLKYLSFIYLLRINQTSAYNSLVKYFAEKRKNSGLIEEKSTSVLIFERFLENIESLVEPTYNFVHLQVPHPPNIHDSDCKIVGESASVTKAHYMSWTSGYQKQMSCANKLAKRFIDKLKELNIFDSSLIIIQSDHGSGLGYLNFITGYYHPQADNTLDFQEEIEERSRILLWIKPPDHKDLMIDNNLAQIIDIPLTVLQLVDLPAKQMEGMNLLQDNMKNKRNKRFVLSHNLYDDRQKKYYLKRDVNGVWSALPSKSEYLTSLEQFRKIR